MAGKMSNGIPIWLTLLLIALSSSACAAARLTLSEIPTSTSSSSVEFIRSSCIKTDYPALCFNSLSVYASTIQTSPKQLVDAALSISLESTRNTSAMIGTLSKTRGMSSKEAEAMGDCIESLGDSVEELKQSLKTMRELRGKDVKLHMNDIQTWVSSALTEENTCMDGFTTNGFKDGTENMVRSYIVKVAHLTSNALALINGMAGSL